MKFWMFIVLSILLFNLRPSHVHFVERGIGVFFYLNISTLLANVSYLQIPVSLVQAMESVTKGSWNVLMDIESMGSYV